MRHGSGILSVYCFRELQIGVSRQKVLIDKPYLNGMGYPDMFRIAPREWTVNYAYNNGS
ncbi:hypothetical protein CBM2637_A200491 [Cupriavidus taiwanensis]|nr:hypothetical protein CBM2637_A200491 [Cupriavidus taiwanensis]